MANTQVNLRQDQDSMGAPSKPRGTMGSTRDMNRTLRLFVAQNSILGLTERPLMAPDPPEFTVAGLLFWSAVDTGHSITLLAGKMKVRDALVLSRVMFETMLNGAFVLAGGNEVAMRALRYSSQRSFRDLGRELRLGNHNIALRWNGTNTMPIPAEVQDALSEFTSARGREIRRWTPEGIEDRIAVIGSAFGEGPVLGLMVGLFSVYRDASEIAHGTVHGFLKTAGLTQPDPAGKDESGLRKHLRRTLSLTLYALSVCMDAILAILAHKVQIPCLSEMSRANLTQYGRDATWHNRRDKYEARRIVIVDSQDSRPTDL